MSELTSPLILLNPDDNVAVACRGLAIGTDTGAVAPVAPIPLGHKMARYLADRLVARRRHPERCRAEQQPLARQQGRWADHHSRDRCRAKSGSTRLEAVYEYAEQVTERGFVFMDTPGYDPVAVTGQIAGGCNIVAFTTGRGSTTGYKPAPTIKLSTNTPMFDRMSDDMDINCGGIIEGTETIEQSGEHIFRRLLAIASGERTFSEQYDDGDNEFGPWQIGAVMWPCPANDGR